MLSSEPEAVVHGCWLTALLPASAALVEGRRQVMTEVSDFAELQAGKGPAGLAQMQATAAWQAALGVTEFTLYYSRSSRPAAEYRAYMDYVGRLNALLRDARPSPTALLYYPICDLWAEYLPVAGPLTVESQSPRLQRIMKSFMSQGQQLLVAQAPFALADHEVLAGAEVREGRMWIKGRSFNALVLPEGVELPEPAARIVEQFKSAGGRVASEGLKGQLQPPSDRIVLGRFTRDGRDISLLVNVGTQAYSGRLAVETPGAWWSADPANGRIEHAVLKDAGQIAVSLLGRASVLLIGPANRIATGESNREGATNSAPSLP
jgi:hypothetical protein